MKSSLSKKRRFPVALVAVLVAAGLWTWRFIAVNAYYHGLVDDDEVRKNEVYAVGDTVASVGVAPSYSIRVDDFEFVEYEDLDVDPELISAVRGRYEGKVGCLYITIFKNDSSREGFPLVDFELHGVDFKLYVSRDLLWALNPELEEHQGIILSQGDSRSFVVPFPIQKALLPTRWSRLDKIPLYLTVSSYKDIRLQ